MEQVSHSESIVLFDGVCNLCNASINFIIDNDEKGYFKFASLQSTEARQFLEQCAETGKGLSVNEKYDPLSSIVLYEGGRCYRASTAVLRIARKLKGAWPLLYACMAIPAPIRDTVYNWVAQNRYRWFGKQEVCRIPTPDLRARFLDNLRASSV